MEKESTTGISRRSALKQLSLMTCALPLCVLGSANFSAAQDKLSKEKADYQDRPQGNQRCGNCAHFLPEKNACVIVQGEISPQAWCKFWAGK